jgi:Ala-tRNA(Pro) deacylase
VEQNSITHRILDLLDENNYWHETFEHEPVRTSVEAATTRPGYSLQQGAKAIIVRTKRSGIKKFLMLVMPADQKFDSRKVKALLQVTDIRFATESEVSDVTGGIEPGGVPPFGTLFGLDVITDPSLYDNEKIVFNAGDRAFSVAMKSSNYRTLVQPRIERII